MSKIKVEFEGFEGHFEGFENAQGERSPLDNLFDNIGAAISAFGEGVSNFADAIGCIIDHVSDSQKQKVYDWEREYVRRIAAKKGHTILLNEKTAQSVSKRICAAYNVKAAPVRFVPAGRAHTANSKEIVMVAPAAYIDCLLHELAHWIVDDGQPFSDLHGARFVRVLVDLLASELKMDKNTLSARLKPGKSLLPEVKIITADDTSP